MNTDIPDLVTHLDPRSCGMTIQLGEQAAREINDLHRRRVAEMLKRERIAELEQELEDWRNAAKGAENPCPDEKHCTCVPLLHKMLKDAREAFAIVTDQLVQVQMDNRKLHEEIQRLRDIEP
jgi:hypothetical protein